MKAALLQASAALERGDFEGALGGLLSAWRAAPQVVELAELVEGLADWLVGGLTPLPKGRRAAHEAWMLRSRRPELVARVGLAGELLPRGAAGWPLNRGLERLERCLELGPDPRWTAPLCVLVFEPFATAAHAGRARGTVLELLRRQRDPRLRMSLDRRAGGNTEYLDVESERALRRAVREIAAALPVAEGPPPEAFEALDALQATVTGLSRRSPDRLVEGPSGLELACLKAPDDLELRAVLADALEEQAAPRAEFLRLQLGEGDPEREGMLLRAFWKDWVGELAPVLRGPRFEGGFLSGASVRFRSWKQATRLLSSPYWSTLRALECEDVRVLRHPSLSGVSSLGLEGAHPLDRRVLARLHREGATLETIDSAFVDFRLIEARLQRLPLTGLRSFALTRLPEVSPELLGRGWAKDLRRLAFWLPTAAPEPIEDWLDAVEAHGQLETLEILGAGWCWSYHWGEDRWSLDLAWRGDYPEAPDPGGEMGAERMSHIRLHPGQLPGEDTHALLQRLGPRASLAEEVG